MSKLARTAAALTVALSTLAAPLAAHADDWRRHDRGYGYGYDRDYGRGYHRGYGGYRDYDRHYYRKKDDHGDAVVAGVAGLAIGALLGSALSQPRQAPPPPPPRQPYYDRYDYRTEYRSGAPDYGYRDGGRVCVSREEVWDNYQRRYITVETSRYC